MAEPILTGSRLGKYEIIEEIGWGGMGTVYRGYDPLLDRDVAVKVLAPLLVRDKECVGRFQREARAAAKLKHPNIVTIYDVGQDGSWYYFVMEYVPGQTLADRLRNRVALPAKEVLAILRPLASALDHAHYQGVGHRDVKPGNVIVGEAGQVTLTDFGIARAMQVSRMTPTGAVVGTAEYMAPEQVQARSVDARSDQYSLGIVAYQMLAGQVPFQADSMMALLYKVVHEPPPPLTGHRPDLPTALGTVIERALAKEPGGRYSTASAFVAAMEQALAGAPVETGAATAVLVEEKPTMTPEPLETAGVPGPATPARARAAAPIPTPAPQPGKVRRTGVPVRTWALGGATVAVLVVVGIGLALAGARGTRSQSTPPAKETGIAAALPPEVGGATVTVLPSSSHTATLAPEPPSTPSAISEAPAAPAKETSIPSPSPSPSSTPTATPEPTSTPSLTATPLPSPTPTNTLPPKASPTAERELAATVVPASPTVSQSTTTPQSVAAFGEMTLLRPAPPGESGTVPTTNGPTVFEWQYGGPVGSGQGFEVRVWRDGEAQVGAHNAVEDNQTGKVVALGKNTYRLEIDISQAAGVKGRTGDYLWTVLLVQIDPGYNDLGIQAPPGRLRFEAPGGEDGGGGGGKPSL